LKVAQDFYQQEEYDKAYATYDRLCQILQARRIAPANAENHKDLLWLRMALCRMKSGAPEQAERLLDTTAKSRSYVVILMTNYHRSLLAMQKKQYLNARTRAYQAIGLIDAVDTNKDLSSSLQSDCYFLVAESMTRNVLSLCDADADLPSKLWSNSAEIDPFAGLNREQLETLLNSGSDYLNEGLLGPQIRKIEHEDGSPRWSVVCNGAPIEELLARFAANAGLDITWLLSSARTPQGEQDTARKKPVILYLPAATTQQVIAVAAGQAGLLARMHQSNAVSIVHPDGYSSLSEHISLLNHETAILWQRFLIAFHSDKRIPGAHFALGLLHARQGNTAEAIAEYKLVANRFSRSSLAPYALLHSSKLKVSLLDYAGARWDLKQLVEQYPDSEITDRAYVYLAENTARAGPQLKSEAARLYRKVYNLGFSSQSQSTAAFGAGKCYFEMEDYEAAAKWLTRYIDAGAKQSNKDLGSAYLLLGKTYLALEEPTQACRALQYALAQQLSRGDYVETVSALINAYLGQKQFVHALDILEDTDSWQFSQKESITILLLKSRILQEMGLVDKAVAELGDKVEYISDPLLKAQISFELTNCHIAKGRLELAHKKLTEILIAVKPGPLAYKVTLKLAEVCLRLGRNAQAISVCSQLWDSAASQQTKHQAAKLLATAYDRQKNYDKAALALLGQPK